MAWIHVRHQVADYDAWKAVYDQTASFKRGYNWQRYQIFAVNGDRNDVLVLEEFATLADAQRFLGSSDLREAMGSAGVTGHPEILVVEGIAEGTA
jgi:hypothetical protein